MAVEVNPAKTSALGSRPSHVAILHHETCFEQLRNHVAVWEKSAEHWNLWRIGRGSEVQGRHRCQMQPGSSVDIWWCYVNVMYIWWCYMLYKWRIYDVYDARETSLPARQSFLFFIWKLWLLKRPGEARPGQLEACWQSNTYWQVGYSSKILQLTV